MEVDLRLRVPVVWIVKSVSEKQTRPAGQGQRIFNSCYRETYVHLTHKNVSTEFLY
jgi:hypothetical protein